MSRGSGLRFRNQKMFKEMGNLDIEAEAKKEERRVLTQEIKARLQQGMVWPEEILDIFN